jgi:hypothetical protein
MREHDLQPGESLEHTCQNQPRRRGRGFHGETDQVPQVIVLHARNIAGILRMQKQRHAEPLGHGENRCHARIVEIDPVDVGADAGTAQTKLRDRALQFVGRKGRVLQRQCRQRQEAVWIGARQLGHPVIDGACDAGTKFRPHPVHQKFRWRTDRGGVQLAPAHRRQNQPCVIHMRTQVQVRFHRDAGRGVEHQPVGAGCAVDFDRLRKVAPAHRVNEARRCDVEVDVDRLQGGCVRPPAPTPPPRQSPPRAAPRAAARARCR